MFAWVLSHSECATNQKLIMVLNMAAPLQARSRATVDALVAAAVHELRHTAHEPNLALDHLADQAGCSVGAIYHHFGDREGLLDAARLAVFVAEADADLDRLRTACIGSRTFDELRTRIGATARLGQAPEHRAQRMLRLSVLTNAAHRPALKSKVSMEQHRLTAELANVFAQIQARNIISPTADPHNVAGFVQAQMLGQVVGDVDAEPIDADVWCAIFDAALVALLQPTGTPVELPNAAAAKPATGQRGLATARALLEAARRQIEANGEAGFRVDEVLAEAGASPSSLYNYFVSREALIEATLIDIARSQGNEDVAFVQRAIDSATTPADALMLLQAVVRAAQQPERVERRRKRLQMFASALRRPTLLAAVTEVENDTTRGYNDTIIEAQRRGLFRSDRDPTMITKFVRSLVFGQVAYELSNQSFDELAWGGIVDDVLAELLLPPTD